MSRRVTPTIMQRLAVAGVAITLAGCGATGTSAPASLASPSEPPPAAAPSAAPATAPAASTDDANQPSVQFAWPDGETPAVPRATTGVDEAYINPGAVIEQDGLLHMYANVFTAWPGPVDTMHLTSEDGASWTLAEPDPVLASDDIPLARTGHDVSTGFVAPDGTWVLVFETVTSVDPWVIGLATAPGPDGPWTVADEPVLTGGSAGEWDSGGLAWPSVVATDDGFAMYYSTYETRGKSVIGRATSTDGRAWTKDADPVLQPDARWEGFSLDRPRVVRVDDGYLMVYAGTDLTDRGVAFSVDGIAWERDGDAPAITSDDFPIQGRAWDAALTERDGVLTYYLEIGTATAAIGTNVFRATASLP